MTDISNKPEKEIREIINSPRFWCIVVITQWILIPNILGAASLKGQFASYNNKQNWQKPPTDDVWQRLSDARDFHRWTTKTQLEIIGKRRCKLRRLLRNANVCAWLEILEQPATHLISIVDRLIDLEFMPAREKQNQTGRARTKNALEEKTWRWWCIHHTNGSTRKSLADRLLIAIAN